VIKCSRSIILIELSKNQQIDWYLQAELAYNKRFGDIEFKDPKDKV
jgi:regulatory protein